MTRCVGLVNRGTEEEEKQEPERYGEGSSEDGDDDLFEINLEAISDTTESPPYDGQRFPARTGSVLLANCLLPAAEISCAVPATSRGWSDLVWFGGVLYVENLGVESKKA
ncbi:unnamed protein product [Arabidopsis arenosa]|uniref:Uncharacterized protein n=1 Tax=Arabidopsis arenosa TaxID=38785 RepID=A0A8S2A6P9_ARAAE|nr:unnamed protein product [Arabidopsis arenosa]